MALFIAEKDVFLLLYQLLSLNIQYYCNFNIMNLFHLV